MYFVDQIKYITDSDENPLGDCPEKFKSIPYHTRCLAPSKYVTKEGISDLDKIEIVEIHDKWRSNLQTPASKMMKMV